MANFSTYSLKVVPQKYKNVYRIIKIDSNSTLDNLSKVIINSFQFDNSHLYMFSMNRKPYDKEGYYHPLSDGKNAAKVKIGSLDLKAKNKFLFLYDFGDEWLFDITVLKIEQSDVRMLTVVTEEHGELIQYGNWDEDELDEEDADDDEWDDDDDQLEDALCIEECKYSMTEMLSRQSVDDLTSLTKVLGIEKPRKRKGLAFAAEIAKELESNKDKILKLLTPSAATLLIEIVENDRAAVLSKIHSVTNFAALQCCGLMQVYEDYGDFVISVTKEARNFAAYLETRSDELKMRSELEEAITAMMQAYGVIETKYLHQMLCDYVKIKFDFKELREKVLNQKAMWNELQMYIVDNESMASIFNYEETQYILNSRDKFKVEKYKKFNKQLVKEISSGDWSDYMPSFDSFTTYLITQYNIQPDMLMMISALISHACTLGINKKEIFELCKEALGECNIVFTNKVKNLVTRIILEHPCALLKGYSFNEYNKSGGPNLRQMSLIDEDLPF